jgi:hypothetical protein
MLELFRGRVLVREEFAHMVAKDMILGLQNFGILLKVNKLKGATGFTLPVPVF